MFLHLFTFEIRYWLRQPMVYIFLLVNVLMFAWAAASDDLTIGGTFGNIYKNSPYVIQNQYGIWCVFALLMTTAFVQSAAIRDFTYKTSQIVFSSPIRKIDYLAGRFLGSFLVSLIPFLGISIGIILGTWIGQATGATDADRYGPIVWSAHLNSFLIFAIPNTFLAGAFIFMLASLTRSSITAFIGAIVLLVAQLIAGTFLGDVENEHLAVYFDALGYGPFQLITKYWTVSEKNSRSVGLTDLPELINRSIWVGVGLLLLGVTFIRFSFEEKVKKARKRSEAIAESAADIGKAVFKPLQPLPRVSLHYGWSAQWTQMTRVFKTDFWGTVKGTAFIVILFAGLLNMGFSLQYAGKFYGLSSYPVTYQVIQLIRGTISLFLFAIIIFYSGAIIWKERDADLDQIYDAMPHRNWSVFVGKFLAMLGIVAIIQLLCILAGITTQLLMGYSNLELGQYLVEFLLIDMLRYAPIIILSMLTHTLLNNKYVAFFAVIALLIANAYAWTPLDIQSNLVQYNASPNYRYSDMNGWGPYVVSLAWFRIYWLLWAAVLSMVAILFWARGKDMAWRARFRSARQALVGPNRLVLAGLATALLLVGGFIFYNTNVLNHYQTSKVQEKQQVAYEKKYKRYANHLQPRISTINYSIDVYPGERNLVVNGDYMLVNRTEKPIDSVHIVLPNRLAYSLRLDRATLSLNDSLLQYRIYKLSPALAPGDSIHLRFTTRKRTKGFENEVQYTKQINQNGSFFDNFDIAPQIGYQEQYELSDKNDRKKYDLPEKARMPALERNCTGDCMNNYLSNNSDWVMVETTISTSPDQLAVAPGSLLKEWKQNDSTGKPRRYFHYKLDHPSLNFYSFISARYEVAREKWNGIDVEVYYDKKHPYNVRDMVESVKGSLAYYTEHFGPYRHKQARIIEFPRYASFAQAFPGTMPYSESIGFISRIDPEEDIDMVKYVVAHEMGHQWWAHQVVGAYMQGATMLSETQAQYSALMVMEKAYDKSRMKRFLKYEMDRYLSSRGTESLKEVPLERVENQGYIHYNKGSAVMYYLKELIGERAVNKALQTLIEQYAYRQPPYPVSYNLVDLFRQQTPDSLQSVITDQFERITIFNNRATAATAKKRPDGQYEVTVAVQAEKFYADSLGREAPTTLNDLIDVGVYGKPAKGKKQGKLLAIRRERMRQKAGTYTFVVKEEPFEAGIDPVNFLVDRSPDDNVKRVDNL
ncbi:M1 family aminopeptidase [Spirosoma sp. SC4-14]|uniref:ABC transporter permease/M1 family aminopeptidase n=1 Tax=Spirosoma sp. SC4-14 TaxID=3128900 RepID=UPI0030D2C58B